jgi:transposase
MPDRYSKWTTVYSRFQRWRKSGVWDRIFAEMQTIKDREGLVD